MSEIPGRAFLPLVPYLATILLPAMSLTCSTQNPKTQDDPVSSRSYGGHENDMDANNLVAAYPSLVATRLDDCQACHLGKMEGRALAGSSCDNCHDLILPGSGHRVVETLNPFGRDYLAAGRNRTGLQAIAGNDSDGDGFSNEEELSAGRYPGSELSVPGQEVARILTIDLDQIRDGPAHRQFLLINNTQQRLDEYVSYLGVPIDELFRSLGIDLAAATGITVIAPDGYKKSLPIEFVTGQFPQPLFHAGLDVETLGAECAVVRYPEDLLAGVQDGAPIPGEVKLILAYQRDGVPLDPTRPDVINRKIDGEGPLRLVVPQERPGRPDRGSAFSPSDCGDGFDFDAEADHNAGAMVRGVIAIRIDPMPEGLEEFDYMNGGWAYVESGQLLLYGHGIG